MTTLNFCSAQITIYQVQSEPYSSVILLPGAVRRRALQQRPLQQCAVALRVSPKEVALPPSRWRQAAGSLRADEGRGAPAARHMKAGRPPGQGLARPLGEAVDVGAGAGNQLTWQRVKRLWDLETR